MTAASKQIWLFQVVWYLIASKHQTLMSAHSNDVLNNKKKTNSCYQSFFFCKHQTNYTRSYCKSFQDWFLSGSLFHAIRGWPHCASLTLMFGSAHKKRIQLVTTCCCLNIVLNFMYFRFLSHTCTTSAIRVMINNSNTSTFSYPVQTALQASIFSMWRKSLRKTLRLHFIDCCWPNHVQSGFRAATNDYFLQSIISLLWKMSGDSNSKMRSSNYRFVQPKPLNNRILIWLSHKTKKRSKSSQMKSYIWHLN